MATRPTIASPPAASSADDFERLRTSEALYRALLDCVDDGIVVLEGDVFVDCNSKALEVFGRSRAELIGCTPFQTAPLSPVDDSQTEDRGRDNLDRAYAGEAVRFDWEHVTSDGCQRHLAVTLTRFDFTGRRRLLAIVRDITEAKNADRKLERAVRFQTLLAEISNEFSSAAFEDVRGVIDRTVPTIANSYQFDRMSLWWFDESKQVARGNLLYGFDANHTDEIHRVCAKAPWIMRYLLSGNQKPLVYPDDIPAGETADHDFYAALDVKSSLIVPLSSGKDLIGIAGMATLHEYRSWSDQERSDLYLFGQIVGNTWVRYQNERKIREQQETLAQRFRFQTLLAEVSSGFLTAHSSGPNDIMNKALHQMALDYGFDRASLWWMDSADDQAYRVYEWAIAREFETETTVFSFSEAPWISQRVLAGDRGPFTYPDDVPAGATGDHEYYAGRGMKSGIIVPITIRGELTGVIGLAALRQPRLWTDQERTELLLLTHVISSAWIRRDDERKLRDRQKDLLRSQRVANVGSYLVTTKDGSPVTWGTAVFRNSAEANRIFGIEDGKESKEAIFDRYHPEDRQRIIEALNTAAKNEQEFELEFRIVRPDGAVVHIEERVEFDRDDAGNVTSVFGTVKDISDRVRAAHELESALEKIAALKDQLQAENVLLKEEVRAARGFETIIGDSAQLRKALVGAEKVAPTDVTVLILGQTGTGKELVARSIHELSDRRAAPLISVNCAALSSDLIESELFGHEAGAFTGAQKQRQGRFELAHGGTLFLDEIGDLPLEVQAKLLRVLQAGEFERLGSTETLTVNVRVIAATNRSLSDRVDRGEFRSDLYFRINGFPIELPPLRDRREDISMLANHFVHKYAEALGKDVSSISADMLDHMSKMPWPGNVRELEGYIQRAMISTDGRVLDYRERPPSDSAAKSAVRTETPHSPERNTPLSGPPSPPVSSHDLESMQRQHIQDVLIECGWVIGGASGAAAALGMPPSSLRSRMKRLGIVRPPSNLA